MQTALASLPETLDDTYARILAKIPNVLKHHTKRILQFLSFSERPLSIEEAVDAIAVETETRPQFNPRYRMPDPNEIIKYCSSLVVVRRGDAGNSVNDEKEAITKNATIQLAHFSVKEYLTSDRFREDIAKDLKERPARASIAQVCLAYLLKIDHSLSVAQIRQTFLLAQYAAQYWIKNAAAVEIWYGKACNFTMEFFLCRSAYGICYQLYNLRQHSWCDAHSS